MAPPPETDPRWRGGRLAARAHGLLRAAGGNVAILFGLLSMPLLLFTGAAIDYGFATRLETKLQAMTDSTALLLCQTPLTTTSTALNTLAQTTMIGAMGATGLVVDPLQITSSPRQITLTAHIQSAVFFGKLTGTKKINPGAVSRCATPVPKTFEIALVLDNTLSMDESSGGQSKLQAVQAAATNFIDFVYGNSAFASGTRISIVPFAESVAVDPSTYRYATWIDQNAKSAYHWQNVTAPASAGFTNRFSIFSALQSAYSGWGWGGCLETLPYPLNVQDGKPSASNGNSYYVPLFAPDEPGNGSTSSASYSSDGGKTSTSSVNSYIDDSTGSGSCPALSSSASFATAEGRACKYVNARNASPTSNNPTTGTLNGPNYGCSAQPLQRLTNTISTLKAQINSMTPRGSTNIFEGFMWGWRTLSPNSVFGDGAAYATASNSASATTVNKIIILMTDGTNGWTTNSSYNKSRYKAGGYFVNVDGSTVNSRLPPGNQNLSDGTSARNALDALTAEACTNAKNVYISVYTIGFSVPSDPIDSDGQTLLQNCASDPTQAFVANTSDDLIKAFRKIQASIGTLRLTQ